MPVPSWPSFALSAPLREKQLFERAIGTATTHDLLLDGYLARGLCQEICLARSLGLPERPDSHKDEGCTGDVVQNARRGLGHESREGVSQQDGKKR